MGEMADFYNDLYGIDIAEAISRKAPVTVYCKNCKLGNLYWKQHNSGKWWLHDGKQWHSCDNQKQSSTTTKKSSRKN